MEQREVAGKEDERMEQKGTRHNCEQFKKIMSMPVELQDSADQSYANGDGRKHFGEGA
jgi:hypothetical protein